MVKTVCVYMKTCTHGLASRLTALFAPRWQSREETHGAEQGTNGGDEPRVAARGPGPAEAHAAEPGPTGGPFRGPIGVVGRYLTVAHAEHASRFRSSTRRCIQCFPTLPLCESMGLMYRVVCLCSYYYCSCLLLL